MGKRLAIFVAVCAAALSAFAVSASASPMIHSSYENCMVFGDWQYCSVFEGTFKMQTTPSGNVIFPSHGTGTTTSTYLPTGAVFVNTWRSNSGTLYKAGDEAQFLWHAVNRSATTVDGVTCRTKYAVVFVAGELRHSMYDTVCG